MEVIIRKKDLDAEVLEYFTKDNKYLATITENGLWIKDEINDQINFINAQKFTINSLNEVDIIKINKKATNNDNKLIGSHVIVRLNTKHSIFPSQKYLSHLKKKKKLPRERQSKQTVFQSALR